MKKKASVAEREMIWRDEKFLKRKKWLIPTMIPLTFVVALATDYIFAIYLKQESWVFADRIWYGVMMAIVVPGSLYFTTFRKPRKEKDDQEDAEQ